MSKNEDLQNDVQRTIKWEPLSSQVEIDVVAKVGQHLKKIIYLTGLIGIGLFINACTATGYVASEPTYVESVRPPRPSNLHVWIDGDWIWSRQTHVYVQRTGSWERPRQGRTFIAGHWQTSPRGKYWVSGSWQRERR
jgi:hypothetical protein